MSKPYSSQPIIEDVSTESEDDDAVSKGLVKASQSLYGSDPPSSRSLPQRSESRSVSRASATGGHIIVNIVTPAHTAVIIQCSVTCTPPAVVRIFVFRTTTRAVIRLHADPLVYYHQCDFQPAWTHKPWLILGIKNGPDSQLVSVRYPQCVSCVLLLQSCSRFNSRAVSFSCRFPLNNSLLMLVF